MALLMKGVALHWKPLKVVITLIKIIDDKSPSFSFPVKVALQVSAAFVILGIIANFISMLLFFPLWHYGFFIAGAVLALTSGKIMLKF